jgi:hypothetical protein
MTEYIKFLFGKSDLKLHFIEILYQRKKGKQSKIT